MTVFAAFYGVLSFAPAAATLQSLQTGMQAPDFSLKTINGEAKSFADVKGGEAHRSCLLVNVESEIRKNIGEDAAAP